MADAEGGLESVAISDVAESDETSLHEKVTELKVSKEGSVVNEINKQLDDVQLDATTLNSEINENDNVENVSNNTENTPTSESMKKGSEVEVTAVNNNVATKDNAISLPPTNGTVEVGSPKIEESINPVEESEGEIVDSDDEDGKNSAKAVDYGGLDDVVRPELEQLDYDEEVDDGEIKDTSDKKTVEASTEVKEMSDGEIASSDGELKSDAEDKEEVKNDDYEEGEMVEDGPPVPRETCRFFERGHCTWGDRCRFIHPGVNDKGRYKMFENERPRPPFYGPPPMRFPPPFNLRGHPIPPGFPPPIMFGPPPPETAWERGLRHAKEMRRRSMQRKVEEPDFMRKREVLSLNEALNVDRDLDYIAQKPLADEERLGDPLTTFEEDERYAVPSVEDVKKLKRFGKTQSRGDGRSPNNEATRRQLSPRPSSHVRREIDERGRDRRSPPRHPGMMPPHPHDRHHPDMPMGHVPSHMRHDYRDRRDASGDRNMRHERDVRDRRVPDNMKERDYRMEPSRNYPPEDERGFSPRRRELESRVVAVDSGSGKRKNAHSGRGDTWSDPWARGRQNVKKKHVRSDSESSGSSSSSSRSSVSSRSDSSYSSRSSSRSSYSSSYSSSASSRSPSPKAKQKQTKAKKKLLTKNATSKAKNSPKPGKAALGTDKAVANVKKTIEAVRPKLTKPAVSKPTPKPPTPPIVQPAAPKEKPPERGRPATKAKTKPGKKKRYESSSSSEFSHSSSSGSRSRSRSAGKESESESDSGSSSGSSSGSESYSSSSSSSSGSSDEEETKKSKPVKKKSATGKVAPEKSVVEKKAVGKIAVPSKPGNKNVKMSIVDKPPPTKPPAQPESRKRSAAAMSNAPTKKVSAIASRRVELLEQLKVVENAILKKRAKLT